MQTLCACILMKIVPCGTLYHHGQPLAGKLLDRAGQSGLRLHKLCRIMSRELLTEHTCMQMPYEDVLPYPEFAVHRREHALYRLPEVLDQIIATEGLVKQPSACLYPLFSQDSGPCAFRTFLPNC